MHIFHFYLFIFSHCFLIHTRTTTSTSPFPAKHRWLRMKTLTYPHSYHPSPLHPAIFFSPLLVLFSSLHPLPSTSLANPAIQYTRLEYGLLVEPKEQVSVSYRFRPDPNLEPRDFALVVSVFYEDEVLPSTSFRSLPLSLPSQLVLYQIKLSLSSLFAPSANMVYRVERISQTRSTTEPSPSWRPTLVLTYNSILTMRLFSVTFLIFQAL
jgi:hypothetical protein